MITEILFVHHSHTDIGFTHPQPVVFELHRRFIDQALDLIDATDHLPEAAQLRWTCESSGIAWDWWQHATPANRRRFADAERRGRIEVTGMMWSMGQLMDHQLLLDSLSPIKRFREEGLTVRSAMNTDVTGATWGLVDALLDHGIEHFSMSTNEHFGHAVQPRPQPFWWTSPSGRKIFAHNGLFYGTSVDTWLKIPIAMDHARRAVPRLGEILEARGYRHQRVIMQATNIRWNDNSEPNGELSRFVAEWNEAKPLIGLRFVTLSQGLDLLRNENLELPEMRGDWPDWWTFGSGGTTRETGVMMAGERALLDGRELRCWPGANLKRTELIEQRAAYDLGLYAEHTYTCDRASAKPNSREVDIEISFKKSLAYDGYSQARLLRRDGLANLARHAGGSEASALLFNPLPFPVERSLRIPKPDSVFIEHILDQQEHRIHRQDVELGDYTEEEAGFARISIPAMGYASLPLVDLSFEAPGLTQGPDRLGNGLLTLRFDTQSGGLVSLASEGTEYVASTASLRFGCPLYERPADGRRFSIYGPPNFHDLETSIDMHKEWHPDWEAERETAKLLSSESSAGAGWVEHRQVFGFVSGENVTVRYRLASGDTAVHVTTLVDKLRDPNPHSMYLPLPVALDRSWQAHYETAGAIVEVDREQLPGSNHHYVTTQRFLRIQDEKKGLSVAIKDLALWQVGGLTFGRVGKNGLVRRDEPILVAWLNNNYWDVNFEVTQSGPIEANFTLLPHQAETLGASMRRALPFVVEPQLHLYRGLGERRKESAALFSVDAGGVLLAGVEAGDSEVILLWLNPDDEDVVVELRPGVLTARSAYMSNLASERGKPIRVDDGHVRITVPARGWIGTTLVTA